MTPSRLSLALATLLMGALAGCQSPSREYLRERQYFDNGPVSFTSIRDAQGNLPTEL